jgi:hypothetical protein
LVAQTRDTLISDSVLFASSARLPASVLRTPSSRSLPAAFSGTQAGATPPKDTPSLLSQAVCTSGVACVGSWRALRKPRHDYRAAARCSWLGEYSVYLTRRLICVWSARHAFERKKQSASFVSYAVFSPSPDKIQAHSFATGRLKARNFRAAFGV